ncbi:hypothetical protein K438DRAFT_1776343 [Mycena galopus ATCC 62051]|nr:hypothetical protein K438DRAFT_1776343 [Mycena galopus ATCC 62051]
MVLMSSYLDNIQTEELSIYEQEDIDLGTGPSNAPQVKTDEHSPGTISLSIAHLQNQGVPRPKRLRPPVPSFIAKRGQQSSSVTCIPPHEYLARGWDANKNQWRSVLWPPLDKDFRAADLEKTAPVWKIQCPL